MMFQALDGKGRHFLDLVDDNLNIIELAYTKGGPWLQVFGHSNLLCAHATRAITNHAPIGEYWLRFFSNEDFKCPCGNYPIKSRWHILHECMRFNGYWNPRRDSLSHFTMFWLPILMLLHSQTINLLFTKLNLVYAFNFLLFSSWLVIFPSFLSFSVLVFLLVCFSCM